VAVEDRIHHPVDPKILSELSRKFPDFLRAYTDGGLAVEEFDTFGPTVRTLRQFIEACHELESQIREIMLPNP
jgi:transaldolase